MTELKILIRQFVYLNFAIITLLHNLKKKCINLSVAHFPRINTSHSRALRNKLFVFYTKKYTATLRARADDVWWGFKRCLDFFLFPIKQIFMLIFHFTRISCWALRNDINKLSTLGSLSQHKAICCSLFCSSAVTHVRWH